ncbi:hypothetical protein COOONC_03779 [Cooperia oncophora]
MKTNCIDTVSWFIRRKMGIDKETCDPTEIDLVRPPPPSKLPSIRVTPRPNVVTTTRTTVKTGSFIPISTSTTTSSTTTTSTTTTTTPPTSTVQTTSRPPRIVTMKTKSFGKRCRITYPRKKVSGSKTRPALVCDSAPTIAQYLSLSALFFQCLLSFLF